MCNIVSDVREIQKQVAETSKRPDQLLMERKTIESVKISERSQYPVVDEEPDLYAASDVGIAY